jgi:hypothetical protein
MEQFFIDRAENAGSERATELWLDAAHAVRKLVDERVEITNIKRNRK